MVKKLKFSLKDKAGKWKKKELLKSGATLSELAGGKDYTGGINPFDEEDTNKAGGQTVKQATNNNSNYNGS